MKEYLLDDLHLIVNHSGYMTGVIFNKWLNEVLVPHVNEKRTTPDQYALLICDFHMSRINEEALKTLKHNNIDMIILPVHSTSKYQLLDGGIYSPTKTISEDILEEKEDSIIYYLFQLMLSVFFHSY